ncbi:unnamed protein product [Prorocentrum cordatum]|uniref:Uncharacterized protein n=1 Tax=Prorocentrum cordatum TaxID=2364126 RepID=A0ABN9VUM9_9DINO|nr:unnamed protein product [Polarella glacialis]
MVCTTCFLFARVPKMAWEGLGVERKGACHQRRGSRAQARNDIGKGLAPNTKPKLFFGALVGPPPEARSRWAVQLGVDPSGQARRPAPEACAGSEAGADVQRSSRRQRGKAPPAGE